MENYNIKEVSQMPQVVIVDNYCWFLTIGNNSKAKRKHMVIRSFKNGGVKFCWVDTVKSPNYLVFWEYSKIEAIRTGL